MLDSNHELTTIKQQIDPCTVLTGYGFTLDKTKSTQNGRVMRRDDAKMLVMRGDNGNWVVTDLRCRKSGTVLDLVQWLDGCNLGQARVKLRQYVESTDFSFPSSPKQSAIMPISLDGLVPANGGTANLRARGIGDWVQCSQFVGKVFEDGRGNACFPHYDDAGLSGWETKNAGFTGFAKNGRKGLWFSNKTTGPMQRLIIAESAIDAISYHAIHGGDDARYLSFAGGIGSNQTSLITRAIERTPTDCLIVLAVDNDTAGSGYIEQITALVNGCRRVQAHQPTGAKDWNEVLMTAPPMTTEEAAAIRAWLELIGETNPAIIAEVLTKCQKDSAARSGFLRMAVGALPVNHPNNAVTCGECEHLQQYR